MSDNQRGGCTAEHGQQINVGPKLPFSWLLIEAQQLTKAIFWDLI